MESLGENNNWINESNESSTFNELVSLVKDCVSWIINYCNVWIAQNITWILTAFLAIASEEPTQAIVFIGMSLFNLWQGFSKYKEYKKLKKFLQKHWFDEKFMKPKSLSWCQRHLSKIASKQTWNLEKLQDFYKREWHYWYHIIPKINRIREL